MISTWGVRKYRHELLTQPFRFFEAIWNRFIEVDSGGLVVGYVGDQMVTGCVLLEHNHTLYYKFAASHPDFRASGVSHGAVRAAMEHGLQRGCHTLDLGRSDSTQPGLIDFKRRFGAQSSQLRRYVATPSDWLPQPLASATLSELTRLFVLPTVADEVTERAGDLLYRHFV